MSFRKEELKMGMCFRCGCQVPGDLPGLCPHCGYLANTDVPPELRKPGTKLTDIRPAEKETGPEQSIPLPEQNAVTPEQKKTAPEEPVSALAWVIVGIVFVACLVSALIIGLY